MNPIHFGCRTQKQLASFGTKAPLRTPHSASASKKAKAHVSGFNNTGLDLFQGESLLDKPSIASLSAINPRFGQKLNIMA